MVVKCRTCLKTSKTLLDLFSFEDLPGKIESVTSVQILPEEEIRLKICVECIENAHISYNFRCLVIESQRIFDQRLASQKTTFKEFSEDNIKEETILLPQLEEVLMDSDYCSSGRTSEEIVSENNNSPTLQEGNSSQSFPEIENWEDLQEHQSSDILLENKTAGVLLPENRTNLKARRKRLSQFPGEAKNKKQENAQVNAEKCKCDHCGKLLSKTHIRNHIIAHTKPQVLCTLCGKLLKNSDSLRGHMLNHKGIQHQCPTCGKLYNHRKGYSDHIKRHKLGDVKTVPCLTCGKMFYDKKMLKKHNRTHTGERPYPCQYCQKSFSSSYARKTHIRQHTNEKPYACKLCNSAFTQKISLTIHLKAKHLEILT